VIFIASILSILFPLATKIPKQLFIDPINRFINLISNNSIPKTLEATLPVELRVLEAGILSLLKTATNHERNKAAIELGHLSARLAHDIYSPLAAMEMGLSIIAKKIPEKELAILTNGLQSVRGIANNVLERYRNPSIRTNLLTSINHDNGNIARPLLLISIVELIVSIIRHSY